MQQLAAATANSRVRLTLRCCRWVCTRNTLNMLALHLQARLQAPVGRNRRHTACGLACRAPVAVRRGGPCRYRDPAAPPDAASAHERSYVSSSQQGLQQQADRRVRQDKDRRLPIAFRGKAVVVGAGPAGALPRSPACVAAVLGSAALCRACACADTVSILCPSCVCWPQVSRLRCSWRLPATRWMCWRGGATLQIWRWTRRGPTS